MPASGKTELRLIKALIKNETFTATKAYIGMSSLSPTALTKATTEKEFKENEITEANGWKRLEIDGIEWEEKEEGGNEAEEKKTFLQNKNVISIVTVVGEIKEERKLETFAIKQHALQAEDEASNKAMYLIGKLETPTILNASTAKFEIPPKKLIIECL